MSERKIRIAVLHFSRETISFLAANADAFAKGLDRLETNVWGLPYGWRRSNIRSSTCSHCARSSPLSMPAIARR